MGDLFGAPFVIDANGENPAEAARSIVRDLTSLVRPPFKLQERVGHMAPSPTKFGLTDDPTASSLLGEKDLTGIRLISLNVDQDFDGGNAFYIEIRIPPPGGFGVDEWSPPWMWRDREKRIWRLKPFSYYQPKNIDYSLNGKITDC